MKHFGRFLLTSLFLLSLTLVQAQDENNPWSVGIQANAVDFYPTGEEAPLGDRFDQYFNVDHWNIIPAVSRLTVGRHIGNGFVFELAGSINSIDTYGEQEVANFAYYAVDGFFNYSLRALLNDGWFDPVIGVGGGYTWVDDNDADLGSFNAPTVNGKLGLNFWLSDNVALTAESNYKHAFEDNTPAHFQHAAGVKLIFGGVDTDGDGVYDKDDECPETAGLPEFNGCPDTDGDGIEDRRDACPDEAGLAEFDGCPDTDGDGVPDPEDDCPNEAGPVENSGCPYEDRDNDGVLDKDDECPDTPGTVGNNGCPEPTAEIISELNEYSNTVLFDLNKATIRDESEEALESIADLMEEYPNTIFHIEGHTDSTGSAEYNEKLSRERAQSVKDYLIEAGIPESRLTSEGYGEERPIATNNTAAGRQENRRVEISLDQDKEMRDGNPSGIN